MHHGRGKQGVGTMQRKKEEKNEIIRTNRFWGYFSSALPPPFLLQSLSCSSSFFTKGDIPKGIHAYVHACESLNPFPLPKSPQNVVEEVTQTGLDININIQNTIFDPFGMVIKTL
jgi:hypothetical protein